MAKYILLIFLILLPLFILAQDPAVRSGGFGGGKPNIGGITDRFRNFGGGGGAGGGTQDSLKKRNKLEDSITITYRLISNSKRYTLDSTISDNDRFPTKPNYITLGNTGAPTKPILFTPYMKAGFDQGKHALDAYRWTIENIKSYKTTRPYSELAYILGSKAEQNIQFTHTQNIKSDWNIAFDYKLISAPGYFRNQKNNHDNLVLNSHYISKKKRYQNWFIYLANNFKNSDFGGVRDVNDLQNPIFKDRNTIQTLLFNSAAAYGNPFSNKIESGQWEKEKNIYIKQSYDLGKKDSIIINDSTIRYLFYSKFRFEHSFLQKTNRYVYNGIARATDDSTFYKANYSATDTMFTKAGSNWSIEDSWKLTSNDFSIYSFPDTKNNLQYIKAGITLELWKGAQSRIFRTNTNQQFTNIFTHFTYKNITKNKKWDIDLFGKLYATGNNTGDYEAIANLVRLTSSTLGNIKLGFQNVNRSPSFVYTKESVFGLYNSFISGAKENHLQLTAQVYNEKKQQNIMLQLLQISNLMTWQNFTTYRREDLFNMLKFSFGRSIKVYKKIMWHTNVEAQQVIVGNPNINYARLYTRNRIAYEGNLGKKNLRLATGIELRYIAPYKLDAWSPLNGQFIYQDSISSKNNLPDITAYLHFNITSFNGFLRVENLNTARIVTGNINPGLSFINNNMAAVRYTNPGMVIRFGVFWRFVN